MSLQTMNYTHGYLELYLGPMWSGKTSELVKIYKRSNHCDIPILAINYVDDNHYTFSMITTHDNISIPCVISKSLSTISDITKNKVTPIFDKAKIILINEGQFFNDILEWVKCAVDKHKKHIYICGLDGDFKRKVFGHFLELIPLCDKVTKFTTFCKHCKKHDAIFSHRLGVETDQIIIGNDYISVCRECYLSLNC